MALLVIKMKKIDKQNFFVICHDIRSAFNVGSIFRTADALGAERIFLCGYTPTPKDEKVKKTALGAEESVGWEKCGQTWRVIERLKKQGVFVVALEQSLKSVMHYEFKPQWPMALVLGNEVKGLPKSILDRCDAVVELPMLGKKESLNVSVAFGAVGYELRRGLRAK